MAAPIRIARFRRCPPEKPPPPCSAPAGSRSRRCWPRGAPRPVPGGPGRACRGWAPFAGILAAAVVLALAARRRGSLAPCAGLLLPVALLLAGAPLAGVRALSGPPLFALALAGVAIAVAGSGLRPPRALFLPLAFAVLAAVAAQTHARVGPEGDEPHYLMVAESLSATGTCRSSVTTPRAATRSSTTRRSRRTSGCGGRTERSTRSTRWACRS